MTAAATRYAFRTDHDETAFDAVSRLCEEVRWVVEFDDGAIEALRAVRVEMVGSREIITREEFVRRLCATAGLTFHAPVTVARVERPVSP